MIYSFEAQNANQINNKVEAFMRRYDDKVLIEDFKMSPLNDRIICVLIYRTK